MSGLRVLGLGRSQDLQLILVTCYFDSGVFEASEKTLLKMSSVQPKHVKTLVNVASYTVLRSYARNSQEGTKS